MVALAFASAANRSRRNRATFSFRHLLESSAADAKAQSASAKPLFEEDYLPVSSVAVSPSEFLKVTCSPKLF